MSSIVYIKRIILELGNLLEDAWTGKVKFENKDDLYQSLRGRLIALSPIIGPLPDFLESADNLWDLWNSEVKGVLDSFEKRRRFLRERYTTYYENRLSQIADLSFEQEMMGRDLAILGKIGEGGFGEVFESEHIVLHEKRAIKKLSPIFVDEEGEEEALRRFSREAKILESLSHPNIVRFFDAGMAGNHPFIVMEFVDGKDLSTLVDSEGPLRYDVAHTIMVQVLDRCRA